MSTKCLGQDVQPLLELEEHSKQDSWQGSQVPFRVPLAVSRVVLLKCPEEQDSVHRGPSGVRVGSLQDMQRDVLLAATQASQEGWQAVEKTK